jgi:Methylene-tetrahydromethanopterin dehydrogenase, N-terminal.
VNLLSQLINAFCKRQPPPTNQNKIKMPKRNILHMFDPMPNNNPFNINIALNTDFEVLIPYSNIKLKNIRNLTQNAIFSHNPSNIKKTTLFIDGHNINLAIDILKTTQPTMVPPFEVSIFADPSGTFTTTTTLVTCVEKTKYMQTTNIIFTTNTTNIELLSTELITATPQLKVKWVVVWHWIEHMEYVAFWHFDLILVSLVLNC